MPTELPVVSIENTKFLCTKFNNSAVKLRTWLTGGRGVKFGWLSTEPYIQKSTFFIMSKKYFAVLDVL